MAETTLRVKVELDFGPAVTQLRSLVQRLTAIADDLEQQDGELTPERLAEIKTMEWTCEGCGGRLLGGQPPRCIGCRKPADLSHQAGVDLPPSPGG